MITRRCFHCLRSSITATRSVHTSSRLRLPENPPAATSTSAAQPFSTPTTPAPSQTSDIPPTTDSFTDTPSASTSPARQRVKSSLTAGAPLRGLDYLKNKDPPLAREDDQYPDWLWTLLDKPSEGTSVVASDGSIIAAGDDSASANVENIGDAFAKSKKQRQLAAKAEKARAKKASRMKAQDGGLEFARVPLHEQSIDLPREGEQAIVAREELRSALRSARRKKIKEQNFLRSMG